MSLMRSENVYFLTPITVKNAFEMSPAEVGRCTQLPNTTDKHRGPRPDCSYIDSPV